MKADLHVHSCHSAHPSEWFLQRLGTRESYTEPAEIYRLARERGMDLVAVTDHNSIDGALWLRDRYPDITIVGVEATTYFPEDQCKIHVLIYDIDREIFGDIERARPNIYDLRSLIRERRLTYSVAHATFNINRLLTRSHIERLLVLFDHFEVQNGSRAREANTRWAKLLGSLTPHDIARLSDTYRIEPFSERSWEKGLTGGSDDHSGLFIGLTWTVAPETRTRQEFLAALRHKQSYAQGRHNDYRSFAFSLYKIAYEFSKTRGSGLGAHMLGMLNRVLLEGESVGLRSRFALRRMKRRGAGSTGRLRQAFVGLVEDIERIAQLPPDRKTDVVYDRLCRLSDELINALAQGMMQSVTDGDLSEFVRSASGFIPLAFLSLPFFTTINVLHDSRGLIEELEHEFGIMRPQRSRRILWFTDTLTDLNGPSETIRRLAWLSLSEGLELIPVACLPDDAATASLPPQLIRLPAIWRYTPSFFNTFTLNVPSVLTAMKLVCDAAPDEILISTPGPVGLIGLLAARLLHVPCRAVYHTDFAAQARLVLGDETLVRGIDDYVRWFYGQCAEIYVPTRHYMNLLARQGYRRERMRLFRRGVEHELFRRIPDARVQCGARFGLRPDGLALLYAGRLSQDKNLDFLADLYERLHAAMEFPISLVVCGDGPFLAAMKRRLESYPDVHFTGRLPRSELPLLYSAADLMVFPSTTDTFGMVVLEAQACGLPAVVSDIGGPQEVIVPGRTGLVAKAGDSDAWTEAVRIVQRMIVHTPEQYVEMSHAARSHVMRTYDWRAVLHDLFGLPAETPPTRDGTQSAATAARSRTALSVGADGS